MMSSKKERDAVMMSRPVMHTATAASFADDDAALHQALRLAAKRPTREQKCRTNKNEATTGFGETLLCSSSPPPQPLGLADFKGEPFSMED